MEDDGIGGWNSLRGEVLAVCRKRGWSMEVLARLGALTAEAAELAEAVRGKRGDPRTESGDVLFTLLALSPFDLPEIVAATRAKIRRLREAPPYVGEERAALADPTRDSE